MSQACVRASRKRDLDFTWQKRVFFFTSPCGEMFVWRQPFESRSSCRVIGSFQKVPLVCDLPLPTTLTPLTVALWVTSLGCTKIFRLFYVSM
ncbi:hypothetical protein JTE90_019265 [Oedothorax gibbosus]|uniref:Uncharacterized protein n=1 Tax=Oedothorax gibbosus TaxID=931172 RepID=A0AAV6UU58_9ARAC|nr:hypothetical protein JTE90_019265 [Oedothorax gibbosus]